MQLKAIFDHTGQTIVMEAETDREKALLGTLFGGRIAAEIHTNYEGHPSYGKMQSFSVTLQRQRNEGEVQGSSS